MLWGRGINYLENAWLEFHLTLYIQICKTKKKKSRWVEFLFELELENVLWADRKAISWSMKSTSSSP
jgi:hypothetical protein